jgi:hypothetical protein
MDSSPQVDSVDLEPSLPAGETEDGSQNVAVADHPVDDRPGAGARLAFWFALGLVFLRFSMLHEMLTSLVHVNLYLLYVTGIPAIIGLFVSGGFRYPLRYRPAILWLLFGVWITLAVPFSIWKGGSARLVFIYWRAELILMLVIAGLTRTRRQCRLLMFTIAAGAVVSLAMSRLFARAEGASRLSLQVGTVSNANDFAAHLLLVLPFLLWVVFSGKSLIVRAFALCCVGYGIYPILASGSRGAAIALVADVLFFTIAARPRQRLVLWVVGPVVVIIAVAVLPNMVYNRILSFSSSEAQASVEALQSSENRKRLLWDSIVCAVEHPLVGIGPGQFPTYQGSQPQFSKGEAWHGTHNTFTQVASECGIPALVLYLAAIISTLRLLKKVRLKVKGDPELADLESAVFCVRLAFLGFCTAIFFLNFAYFFYLPAITGLVIAMFSAVSAPSSASAGAALEIGGEQPS